MYNNDLGENQILSNKTQNASKYFFLIDMIRTLKRVYNLDTPGKVRNHLT